MIFYESPYTMVNVLCLQTLVNIIILILYNYDVLLFRVSDSETYRCVIYEWNYLQWISKINICQFNIITKAYNY